MKTKIAALVLLLGSACARPPPPIERVTVRNEGFEVVRIVEEPAALDRFAELWKMRREIGTNARPLSEFPFKLDIVAGERGDRWMYSKDGFTTVLTVKAGKLYRIDDPTELNAVLGLE